MYNVKVWHCRPCWRNGDLEKEEVVIDSKSFKTRKDAKAFIEGALKGKPNVCGKYHKGDERSYRGYYTDKTWTHENTGEECKESYTYVLEKA